VQPTTGLMFSASKRNMYVIGYNSAVNRGLGIMEP
jgi:hypothetical protein